MCLSEVSTPLLHLRWFYIQTKAVKTYLFNYINISAAAIFIFYRVILIPLLVLPHLALEWFRGCLYTSTAPLSRRLSFSLSCCLWVILNFYWMGLFIRSLLKQREPQHKKTHTQ